MQSETGCEWVYPGLDEQWLEISAGLIHVHELGMGMLVKG